MNEQFYFTLSINGVTLEESEKILQFAIDTRMGRAGISVSYEEVI